MVGEVPTCEGIRVSPRIDCPLMTTSSRVRRRFSSPSLLILGIAVSRPKSQRRAGNSSPRGKSRVVLTPIIGGGPRITLSDERPEEGPNR